jgi:hypothetical protein
MKPMIQILLQLLNGSVKFGLGRLRNIVDNLLIGFLGALFT